MSRALVLALFLTWLRSCLEIWDLKHNDTVKLTVIYIEREHRYNIYLAYQFHEKNIRCIIDE